MKKTVAFYLLPISVLTLVLGTAIRVSAEDVIDESTTDSPKTKIQEIREDAKEKRAELKTIFEEKKAEIKEKVKTKLCEHAGRRIDTRITKYDDGQTLRLQRLDKIHTRLTTMITRLSEKGYDASLLQGDVTTLEGYINEMKTAYAKFIDTLKSSKDLTCGESEGQFKGKIDIARGELQGVRDINKKVVALHKVIAEHLVSIKSQKVTPVTDTTTTTTPTGSTEAGSSAQTTENTGTTTGTQE